MYVSLSEEDRVAIFDVDADTGRLSPNGAATITGRPAPMALDPTRRVLFVGRRDIPQISSYLIDQGTGDLSLTGSVSLEADPCYLATDRRGKFLFSSYYNAGKAAVHPIGADGSVGAPPIEWRATGGGAHSIQSDATNKFVFVPHIAGGNGPNAIFQFRFDENTGILSPNSPPTVPQEDEAGPRHFCFHPDKSVLYFSNEQGCSVTAYNFDRSAGTLTAFQTLSTLPDGYEGRNSCAQIQITPSGKFLYAPNRGHNSIACFSLDASDGSMKSIGRVPTEAVPRAIGLDPDGNFLYAAGLESGRLAAYRIEPSTGELSLQETYEVGQGPMWVLVARSPA
jgi:6-phosphogluconolactonase